MTTTLSLRRFALAAAASLTLAGTAFAGQSGSDAGTRIYSPSPLIVQTDLAKQTAVSHEAGLNRQQKPVRVADAGSVGTSIYAPGPLVTMTRHDRLVAAINQAYGTSFAPHSANAQVAMNSR